jgi:hypothetical protein
MPLTNVILILAIGFIVIAMAAGSVIRGIALSADPNDLKLWYDTQDQDEVVDRG